MIINDHYIERDYLTMKEKSDREKERKEIIDSFKHDYPALYETVKDEVSKYNSKSNWKYQNMEQ